MTLTAQALGQELVRLGFTQLENQRHFSAGTVRVRLLDASRLLLSSPEAGMRYIAVLSLQHLAQEVAAFTNH